MFNPAPTPYNDENVDLDTAVITAELPSADDLDCVLPAVIKRKCQERGLGHPGDTLEMLFCRLNRYQQLRQYSETYRKEAANYRLHFKGLPVTA